MNNQSQPLSSLPLPPSTLSSLTKAGYETLEDLSNPASQLTNALKSSIEASQSLYSSSQRCGTLSGSSDLPSTQSAAELVGSSKLRLKPFATRCPPVDELLTGGLSEGHILEVSGPPGSPKELILLNIIRSFVEVGRNVLLADCQNMCDPRLVEEYVKDIPAARQLVSYVKIATLTEFMMFMHNLSSYPKISMSLLAISCISFPFQNSPHWAKSSLLEKVKQTLTKLSSQNVTIVVTSQLATKMLKSDGSIGSFDSVGARGVMVPQLDSTYLPLGKTTRILLSLSGPTSGSVRLQAPVKTGKHTLVKSFEIRGRVLEETES